MAIDESQLYVDWTGLRYYDQRIKTYIQKTTVTQEEQDQLRTELEQLEQQLLTFGNSFTIDKEHIYEHIEECRVNSASKKDLTDAVATLRDELRAATGVDLSKYATIAFVEERLQELPTLPDDVSNFVTKDELAEELGKLTPPSVDVSELATKEDLEAVTAKIPSVDGLASESYVEEQLSKIEIPTVPTKVSAFENDAGYLTEHQSLDGLATEQFVTDKISEIPEVDLTDYVKKADLPDTSNFLTSIPDEYVTESELTAQGYLVATDIENLATTDQVEAVQQNITNFETVVSSTYIKLEDGVTKDELDTAVNDVVTSQVESLIDEKIEDVLNSGATVSSISYDEF